MLSNLEHLQKVEQLQKIGEIQNAIDHLKEWVQQEPTNSRAHVHLAKLLKSTEDLEGSKAHYQRALALGVEDNSVLINVGNVCLRLGNAEEAKHYYQQALEKEPDNVHAHSNMVAVLLQEKQYQEAEAHCQQALKRSPNHAPAHFNLGLVHKEQQNYELASSCFRKVVKLSPTHIEAYAHLGVIYQKLENLEEAEVCYRKLLELDPHHSNANANLGGLLTDKKVLDEAEKCCRRAIDLDTHCSGAHANLGRVLAKTSRAKEALSHYKRALDLGCQDDSQIRFNLAWLLLSLGELEEGWEYYESRWSMPGFKKRNLQTFTQPVLEPGTDVIGKRIIVWKEQGYGDYLQIVRYIPLLLERGAEVWLQCPLSIQPLFVARPHTWHLLDEHAMPTYDYHLPIMSLPRFFETTLQTIPHQVPYLSVEKKHVDQWAETFQGIDKNRIGIIWKGSRSYKDDAQRSIPLESWLPLVNSMKNVQFFSLQLNLDREEQGLLKDHNIIDVSGQLTDFAETAAALQHLDLLITVDTAGAHLAGALARPVWVLLPYPPDWRWLFEGENSPWYPTMRLFRQSQLGDWRTVFDRVIEAVKHA